MDLDHGNGSSKYSRTDIKETEGNGSNKQLGKHQGLDQNRSRNYENWIVGNGSNKHSTTHLEHDDEAGSSEHSSEVSGSFKNLRRYLELNAETGSSNQSDSHSEVINGDAGIESNHFELNPDVIKLRGNNHNKTPSDSSKQSEVIQEDKDQIEGDKLISAEKRSSTSSSSSSSSSDLSRDDLFQVDIKQSKTRSDPKPEENDIQFQSLQDKHDVPGNNSSKLEEGQNGDASRTLTSEVSSVTDEPTLLQSPPVQVMDRVGELDSYKIPSAVFARSKSITLVDHWSLPSNESLFSIRLENGSFARDHIVGSKSGELFKSGEFDELSPVPVPAVPVEDTDEKGGESEKREETSVSDDVVQDKTGPSIEEPNVRKPGRPMISWNSATIAHHSVDRVATAYSIAFPVRNKKKCAWPSCNCSNCWLAVCYNWKCTISQDGTCLSSKEKAQKQRQKELPMASLVPSKSARCNCYSFFSSCRWHWCCSFNSCQRNCCSRIL